MVLLRVFCNYKACVKKPFKPKTTEPQFYPISCLLPFWPGFRACFQCFHKDLEGEFVIIFEDQQAMK